MDKKQRSTLRSLRLRMADGLHLDEDFYAATLQLKIFTESMISEIKTVTIPRDQVFKMLELLEKRGPKAFDNFVSILREHYAWLADELEKIYQQKLNGETTFARGREEEHTQPKSMSYEKEDMTRVQSLCQATSNPAIAQRTSKKMPQQPQAPVFASVSMTGRNKNNNGQFFQSQFQNPIQPGLNDNNDEDESTAPQFTDACISPIQTLESPRKKSHATCSPIPQQHSSSASYNPFKLPYISQENATDEPDYGENEDQVFEDDYVNASDTNSNRDGNDFDNVDGFDNDGDLNNCVDPNEDDRENSEVFYHTIRHKSQIEDEENEHIATQIGAEIAAELNEQNSEEDNEIDRLTEIPENSAEQKLKTCYDLFDEKDKKTPLNKLIEKLKEEKLEYSSKFFEEVKKTNEMANDMYNHSQEKKNIDNLKSNIDNLKSKLKTLEMEHSDLESKYIKMEDVNGRQSKRIEELERTKKEYEDAELLDEKRMTAVKKGSTTRKSNYGETSPRRAPLRNLPSRFTWKQSNKK